MRKVIFSHPDDLEEGEIVKRPNRFTLIVRLGSSTEGVYLANPGALSTVIFPGRIILCEPASGEDRKTDYNAFAILVEDIYVTVGSTFANTIFSEALKRRILEYFRAYSALHGNHPLFRAMPSVAPARSSQYGSLDLSHSRDIPCSVVW